MQVAVVGGGVIGLTTAYHLAREGAEVTVLDARATGLGASAVNAGWFVPAEAMPVPGPKVVVQTLKWMLRPDSPVYIRPSLDPRFVRFMLRMWRHCNDRDQRAGFAAHLRLALNTAHVLDEYRADGMDFEMHSAGLLMAFTEKANLDHHVHNLDLVYENDLGPQVLVGDDVRAHEPLLTDAVYGGIFYPTERHLDPRAFVEALHKRLVELGVRVVENAAVETVETRETGGRRTVTAVRTPVGRFEADAVVLAAGAWTGDLSARFGHRLPVRPGKGYSVDVDPLPLRSATNLSDVKVAVTPFSDRLRLAGTMEFAGLDENVNDVRVSAILRGPQTYFRGWQTPDVTRLRPTAGMRPMTPDGLPVIGAFPGLANTYVTSGHGMLGVTLAAGSALALADTVLHGTRRPELAPFDPARFDRSAAPTNTVTDTKGIAMTRRTADLHGIIAAVPTPFTADGSAIDEANLRALADRLVAGGLHGVVATGSTGEFNTLSPTEYRDAMRLWVEAIGGRIPVVAGVGSLSTADAVSLAQHAESVGADAIMILPPFYAPPDFDGLVAFLTAVTGAISIPAVYYNIPSHTGVSLTPEQLAQLGDIPGLDYMKDTSGDAVGQGELLVRHSDRITVFNGWDTLTFFGLASGAKGAVWGVGSIVPELTVQLWDTLSVKGDLAAARELWKHLWAISDFLESVDYAAGIKAGLAIVGHPAGPTRAPSLPLSQADIDRFTAILAAAGQVPSA